MPFDADGRKRSGRRLRSAALPDTVRRLNALIRVSHGSLALIVGLGLLSAAFEGLGLYLFMPLLESATAGQGQSLLPGLTLPESLPAVPVMAGLFLLCILLKNVVTYANASAFAWVNCQAGHELRLRLYHQILQASIGHVEGGASKRISNAMLSESWRAVEALGTLFRIIVSASAALALFIVLLILSWKGALLILPVFALVMGMMRLVSRANQRLGEASVAANQQFIRRFWETMEGLRTIRNFGTAAQEEARFAAISDHVRAVFLHMQRMGNRTGPVFEVTVALALTLWVVALWRMGSNLGQMATFLLVLYRFQGQMRALGQARAALQQVGPSVAEIESVGAACAASALPAGETPFTGLREGITLRDVSYGYPGRARPALDHVSLMIPRNCTTALIGPSGAGKSTLISLICRMMDPDEGEILIDGTDLRSLRPADWTTRVAVVSQEVHLFDATIAENIAYGLESATRAQIETAAARANCAGFIGLLPQGYDTLVGDRGIHLSGGQRQRITLARALIRDPDLLILDEATNALDAEAETAIQQALAGIEGQVTMLVIAHRLTTIREAARIVVLEQGRVVEDGTPEALRRAGGYYARAVGEDPDAVTRRQKKGTTFP